MRRQLSALAIGASTLVLMAARCSGDEDDGVSIGAYPQVEGEESGAGAAAPPDDVDHSADPKDAGAGSAADASRPKLGDEPKEASDDLFADPMDGANAGGGSGPKVDDETILEDQSTFEPGGSGLPNVVGPDGDSLPQVPGPDTGMPELGGDPSPDLTE